MSGDTNSRRAAFAKAVALRCSTDELFAANCRARDRRGNRVVIPMLDSDPVDLACRFVVQSGGEGTLVILDDSGARTDRPNTTVASFKVRQVAAGSGAGCVPFDSNLRLADLMKVLTPGVSMDLARRDLGGAVSLDEIERTDIGGDAVPATA